MSLDPVAHDRPADVDDLVRCAWSLGSRDYRDYHDLEWGRPVHGDTALFERLSLEAFQSGLSWLTILRKRPAFREAFAGFAPEVVAGFGTAEVARLLADTGIVRNRAKFLATIGNARAVLTLEERDGVDALDRLVWSFPPQVPAAAPRRLDDVPAATDASRALARALRTVGLTFVGPRTAYAAMQACGLVDDHLADCAFRRAGVSDR